MLSGLPGALHAFGDAFAEATMQAPPGIVLGCGRQAALATRLLLTRGARAVLVKGGHRIGDADDLFMDGERHEWLRAEHIESTCTHGTGCSLSAATAAGLALGMPLFEAVKNAKQFITEAIRHGYTVGKGHSPVNHFYMHEHARERSVR